MQVSESYLDPLQLVERLDRSLARLGTDYIDIYQIHWHSRAAVGNKQYPDRPLAAEVPLEETLRALDTLRKGGKIRHIGVCNFGVADLRAAIATGVPIVSNQVCYNLLWRGIETELVPLCIEHGISILPWSPLQQGILTGKFETADTVPEGRQRTRLFSGKRPFARHGEAGQEDMVFAALDKLRKIAATIDAPMATASLAWVLGRPAVACVLMGARNAEQVSPPPPPHTHTPQSPLCCLPAPAPPATAHRRLLARAL